MTWGLTPAGFVTRSAPEIKAAFDAAFRGIFGASVGSEADGSIPAATSLGQEIALLVESESSAWETLAAVYAAWDADQATSPQLEALCALTGTARKPALASSVVATCYGVALTSLPAGRVLTVRDSGTRFVSSAAAVLAAPSASWARSTAFAVGQVVSGVDGIWTCAVSGTSASTGSGPVAAAASSGVVTESTGVRWRYVCPLGRGVAQVPFFADRTGPLAAPAGLLTEIATPVSGWQGAVNASPADVGRDIESIPALRARRIAELQSQSGGPADAIRARILAVSAVQDVRVFANDGDVADAAGVPPHGVEVLIRAPSVSPTADAELALLVWRSVAAGIATAGNVGPLVVADAAGALHSVRFSRPSAVPVYLAVTVYYDPAAWAAVASPAAAVQAATVSALLTAAAGYEIGQSVRASLLAAAVVEGPQATQTVAGTVQPLYPAPAGSQPMPGVVDVVVYLGTSASPSTSAPVTVGPRQIAAFDAARIAVTATPLAP